MRKELRVKVATMLAWLASLGNGGFWHAIAIIAALPGAEELLELVNEAKPELTGLGWTELSVIADVLREVENAHEGEEVARAIMREFFGYEEEGEEYDGEEDE